MLEELQRRSYSQTTVTAYLKTVAKHFHKAPDQLRPDEIRSYQVYLVNEKKLGVRTAAIIRRLCAKADQTGNG